MGRNKLIGSEKEGICSKLEFDRELARHGCLVGIDEAGRGPWAGPVVAAAVSFPPEIDPVRLVGLDDSKKISPEKRTDLAKTIEKSALSYGIGIASPAEIDRLDIEKATFLAMRRALEDSGLAPDLVLVDGHRDPGLGWPTHCIVRGDGRSAAVAAASILAKTNRDRYMELIAGETDPWGFAGNKGYGTEYHRRALAVFGPGPHHRKTFRPVTARFLDSTAPSAEFSVLWERLNTVRTERDWEEVCLEIQAAVPHLETNEAWVLAHRLNELEKKRRKNRRRLARRQKGRFYEKAVIGYLEQKGYVLLEKNFKGQSGEIDLIAKDGEQIVFIEVKMRRTADFGSGMEAVDSRKRKRICAAAREFLPALPEETPVRFDVISLDGTADNTRETRLCHIEGAFEMTEWEEG